MSGLCKYFEISRNGYYKGHQRAEQQFIGQAMVAEMIVQERRLQPRLGGRKLYHLYGNAIHDVCPRLGRDKFFELLRREGLLVARKRRHTRTTNSYHRFRRHRNLLKDAQVERPNQAWVTDITYIRLRRGFAYLSLLTDYYSRKVVGWHLSRSLEIEGSLQALRQALSGARLPEGLIHHSDRGAQYCSTPYTSVLEHHHIRISMTEENHCYENALAERVNGILKDEYSLDATFSDCRQAHQACEEAVELYNTRRPHWALGFKTPAEVHQTA